MNSFYNNDLAYIHDSGHGDFARNASIGLLNLFKENIKPDSLILDLGCGSGILEKELLKNDYKVIGIDFSEEMIKLAKKNAPEANYLIGSFFELNFPESDAIVSISECINYLFDEKNSLKTIEILFEKVFKALKPGGIFVFDFLEPGQLGKQGSQIRIAEGKDWYIINKVSESKHDFTLSRDLTIFRKIGQLYNKTNELHRVRLYKKNDLARILKKTGFKISVLKGYGEFLFRKKHTGFIARK
jgi:SAM-dependent methyltransferase